jgi:hypothetical protein
LPELHWLKSSFSGDGGNNCVEIAAAEGGIALRESDAPSIALRTSSRALSALLRSTQAGLPARSRQ